MSKQPNRRGFLGSAAGGAAALGLATLARGADKKRRRRPNVIYAFSDEHRWQSMSIGEMPALKTPHMAKMARQGMNFTHCISNYPVCSPHRAIFLSGRWPHQTGIIDNSLRLKPSETTIGKAFKAAGYATAYIGKWHLGGSRAEPHGFDHSLIWTGTNNHWNSRYHPKDAAPVKCTRYNATAMTDQALEFIEANRARPFFLVISWNPPHSKFTDPPKEKKALYPDGSLPLRKNYSKKAGRRKGKRGAFGRSWAVYQGYHAHVSAIDDELGRLMAKLDQLGLADDTILVYSSDHGSMLGSQGVGGKRQPYEESIRVPFLIRWPGVVPAGKKSDALFGTIDVMPTIIALAGLPVPDTCEGLDFSPTLRGGQGPEPESQFIMHIDKHHASGGIRHPAPLFRGVRTARHTYAVYPDRPWCLFDNHADPYQTKNLIADPAHAATIRHCRAMLAQWLQKAEDPFEIPTG